MSGFEENSTEEVCRVWVEVASGVSLEDQFPELNQSKPSNGRKNRNTQEVSPLTEFVLATCSEAQYKDAQKRRLAEKSPSAVAATEIAASAGNVGPSQKIERNIRPKARAGAIAATNSSPLADPGDRIPVKITFSQTGTEINAPVSKLFMENPENMLKESHDLTSLAFLEEANVLAALKVRFTNEYVYTSIAGVIIAINPCKKTPIYSFEVMKSFRNTSNLNSLGSHIYKAAEEAYRNLTMKFNFKYKKAPTNQSMVICGESGSGKTESSKHIMRYLTNRSNDLEESQLPQSNENQISIEQQIMQTNFILEVIGNAKTKLNHNSSRFGKFTKVYFNTANLDPNYDGKNPPPNTNNVVGAATNTYLLEKSRVVIQSPGERNYHIFYGLVSAARQQLSFDIDQFNAEHLGIVGMDIKDFSYLAASSSDFEESKKDAGGYNSIERFEEMVKAFKSINLPEKEQRGIMEIIAGILHLGNIELQDGVGDQAFVTEKSHRHLEHAARLLSIKQDDLTNRITTQTIRVRGEIVIKKLRKVDAIVARDAISKTIYETLFLFLVGRVNNSLMQRTGDSQNSSLPWIGILDVFGFGKLSYL